MSIEETNLQPLNRGLTPAQTTLRPYLPMVHGAATNNFHRIASAKNYVIDRNGNATIELEGLTAFIEDFENIKRKMGIGSEKMLDLGTIELTNVNQFRPNESQQITTAVAIPLQEYGRLRGFEKRLTPRATSTKEEVTREKKRLANVMRDIRTKANQELDTLYNCTLSWTEPGRRKKTDYYNVRILQFKTIKNGYIILQFTQIMAAYLLHSNLMWFPPALFALDDYSPRAYIIGKKLAVHYGNDNNRGKGTYNIISTRKLLDYCDDIPTFEDVQASKDRGHWERRIKEPLENALETLLSIGVLKSWEYCKSKRLPLDADQIGIDNYQTFIELYIHFEMQEMPDQSERLQHKAERIEAAKARRKKKGGNK